MYHVKNQLILWQILFPPENNVLIGENNEY